MLECCLAFQFRTANSTVPGIFVVPVCSVFWTSLPGYLEYLRDTGALDQASTLIAATDLRHATTEAIETLRREVRALLTAAEVECLLPSLPSLEPMEPMA